MLRVILSGLAAGALIVGCSHALHAQSCASSYQARSYSYRPSYSYAAPAVYAAPAKAAEHKAPVYKEEKVIFRYVALFPVLESSTYGAAAAYQHQHPLPGQFPAPALPGAVPQQPPPNGPAAAPRPDQSAAILDAINKLGDGLGRLNARIDALEKRERQPAPKRGVGPKEPPEPEPDGEKTSAKLTFASVNKAACAACHSRSSAKEHGAEFVLSEDDGRIVRLSSARLRAMQRVLLKDSMPLLNDHAKKHQITAKLSKEQKDAIFAGLYEQIAAAE